MYKLGRVYNYLKKESERIMEEVAKEFNSEPTVVPSNSVLPHSFFFYMYDYKFLAQIEMYSDCESSKEGFLTFYRNDKDGWKPMYIVGNGHVFRFFLKGDVMHYETGLQGKSSLTKDFSWWCRHLHESFVDSFANQRLPLDLSMIRPMAG